MSSCFYDGKEQSSSRGRVTIKDGTMNKIVMMHGRIDTSGKNIEFLKDIVNELIDTVNNQHREILKLKESKDAKQATNKKTTRSLQPTRKHGVG